MHVLCHLLFMVMGEASAIPGADRIDITHIGGQVQELAGLFDIHPIPGLVLIQPFFAEGLIRHSEVSGDPLHIFFRIGGRHGLAAIGAIQAIRLCPGSLVGDGNKLVQTPWGFFLQPGEEPFYTLLIMPD